MAVVTKTLRATGTNTSLVRASNVVTVTLTTASTPNVKAGDTIVISGSTATTDSFNGTFTVASVTSTTVFTYAQTGADETATAAGSSGGDYSLMSTWESTEQTDLVTDTDTHELHCYNDWPSGLDDTVAVQGWVSNSTYYPTVQSAVGQGHNGVWNAGFGLKTSTGGDAQVFLAQVANLRVRDMFFWNTSAISNAQAVNNNEFCYYHNCWFRGGSNVGSSGFANLFNNGGTLYNCIAYNTGGYGFHLGNFDYPYFYNCAAVGNNVGFHREGTDGTAGTCINCVAYGNGTVDWSGTLWTGSNNASEDGTAVGTSPVTGIASTDFVDYANDNYRPEVGGALFGAGTDLSLASDIRGETPVKISIGAYDSDGFYRTLKTSAGDYSSAVTWEAALQADLVSLGDKSYLECYTGSYNERVDISGWTSNDTFRPVMRAATGEEHGGVFGAGVRFYETLSFNNTFKINSPCLIKGIEMENLSTSTGADVLSISTTEFGGAAATIESCLIRNASVDANTNVVTVAGTKGNQIFRNCVLVGSRIALQITQYDPATIENCTILDYTVEGFLVGNSGSGAKLIKNCAFYSAEPGALSISDGTNPDVVYTTNATHDTEGDITGLASTDFVDYAGGDYTPTSTGALAGAATNLSWQFVDDITDNPRTDAALFGNDDIVTMANGDIVHYKD